MIMIPTSIILTLIFRYIFIYVSALFKTHCLILVSSYSSLYVALLNFDYVNKIKSLSLSLSSTL